MKTAKAMGIKTVAVYSQIDANAMHVMMADESVLLGPAPSSESYLRSDIIIAKAITVGADAIHPGYGFLSENAEFARLCEQNNIIFIGPPVDAITAMGSKSTAKKLMHDANVPLVPGYHGEEQSPDFLQQQAQTIGYPVLLKASAGGGGKGMRTVFNDEEFQEALTAAKRESMKSFADDHMLIEKFLIQPRHIEIQVFCDNFGNAVHLFERDCSVQRRHQKIIEEAPAPNFPAETRDLMGETAKKAALAIGYRGAGTVEFLYDCDGRFYFMEMNTRLQVEHPVTEYITGLDLVKWQIDIANGKTLPESQETLAFSGHAIEARIYAEDPDNDFLPSTGSLKVAHAPPKNGNAIRLDTGVQKGDEISVYYDPMIAKLIAYGEDRQTALALLEGALQEYRLGPIKTNISYLLKVIRSQAFINADLTTNFVTQNSDVLNTGTILTENEYLMAFVVATQNSFSNADAESSNNKTDSSVFYTTNNFRLNHEQKRNVVITSNQTRLEGTVTNVSPDTLLIALDNKEFLLNWNIDNGVVCIKRNDISSSSAFFVDEHNVCIFGDNGQVLFDIVKPNFGENSNVDDGDDIIAPMNGVVVDVLVDKNDEITKGQTLIIIEAMKMEQSIKSPRDGVIDNCNFETGDRVDGGASLITLMKN